MQFWFPVLCLSHCSKKQLSVPIKARDRKVVGDLEGARHYGSTARSLNIVATVLTGFIVLIVVIAYSVRVSTIR
uniref:Uncharacterized protein n=1 Tax=Stegastes partitus TaxID=144197 RepID=A0A3B5B6W4_9TELE